MNKKLLAMLGLGATLLLGGGQAIAATYQIKAGDTLWKLSNSYQVSVSDIQHANPGIQPFNLQVGQTIQIPGIQTYVAQQNDTLWKVAQKYHVTLNALIASNPKVNPLNIYQGLVITIPSPTSSGAASVTATQATTAQPVANASTQTIVASNGQSFSYSKEVDAIATAYTASAASNGSWGAIDYFGNPLKLGTIAVDPSVIPLGSKLYITGYSFNGLPVGGMVSTASDIGGGIKGNRIDIFVPTSDANASNFGMQNVKVYILK